MVTEGACRKCRAKYQTSERTAGRRVECAYCGRRFVAEHPVVDQFDSAPTPAPNPPASEPAVAPDPPAKPLSGWIRRFMLSRRWYVRVARRGLSVIVSAVTKPYLELAGAAVVWVLSEVAVWVSQKFYQQRDH